VANTEMPKYQSLDRRIRLPNPALMSLLIHSARCCHDRVSALAFSEAWSRYCYGAHSDYFSQKLATGPHIPVSKRHDYLGRFYGSV